MYRTLDYQNLSLVSVLLFAVFWPIGLVMFMAAEYFILLAIWNWRGNVKRKLWLKLLDDKLRDDHAHDA